MRNLFLYVWKTQRAERKECQKKNEIRKNLLKGVYMYWCMFTHTHIPYIYRYMDFYILYALLTDLQAPHLYACVSVCECVYVYIYLSIFDVRIERSDFTSFWKWRNKNKKQIWNKKNYIHIKIKRKTWEPQRFFLAKTEKKCKTVAKVKGKQNKYFYCHCIIFKVVILIFKT